jgi:rhodanese-related sulfurtransferase
VEVTESVSTIPRIEAREALRLVAEERAVVVDVREAEELARTGKLAGALHLPLRRVPLEAPERLPKDLPLLFYCAAGIRSAVAADVLRGLGYERLFNLGGIGEAAAAGFPVEPA